MIRNFPVDQSQQDIMRMFNLQDHLYVHDVSDSTLNGYKGHRLIDLQDDFSAVPDATYYCAVPLFGLKTGIQTDVKATFSTGTVTVTLYTTFLIPGSNTLPGSATARITGSPGATALATTINLTQSVGTDGEQYAVFKVVVASSANPTFTRGEVVGL